ncbi:hypothetical protein OH77DRAFT_1417739 [Trametes cingulata]|nr:hypothetical protein OH77DRAFT_1417739 [Trametes cingulata]
MADEGYADVKEDDGDDDDDDKRRRRQDRSPLHKPALRLRRLGQRVRAQTQPPARHHISKHTRQGSPRRKLGMKGSASPERRK